jgi:hypothetical protein
VSGVLSVLAAGQNSQKYDVVVANHASDIYGYNPASSPSGSISSTSFKGVTIDNVGSDGGSSDFSIVLDGSLAQSFFSGVIVQGTSGVRYLRTSDATHAVFGGGTLTAWQWAFGVGGDPVWTDAATRFMLLQY